ncbi:creatininase family protein [Candidatus Bathyarchaeota archaeon]|nr:creatininase family protein [Candidatus Bathyarchaeota archaeon]
MVKWDEATSKEIKSLDKNLPVVLPLGSIEIHGPHLPLGTDTMIIYEVALKASELEEAIVLPPLAYCYAPENKHFPGTISISAETLLRLIEEICSEVSRNGFKKLIILNGHGGNRRILRLLMRDVLDKGLNIALYSVTEPWSPIRDEIEKVRETDPIEHACEIETSFMLFLNPEGVRLSYLEGRARTGISLENEGIETNVDWISYALEGYIGDPRKASEWKGKLLIEKWIEKIARIYKIVKEDRIVLEFLAQYRKASQAP